MNTDRQDQIAAHAYSLWDAAGRPEGEADRFWREAEQTLQVQNTPSDAQDASPNAAVPQQSELEPAKTGKATKPA